MAAKPGSSTPSAEFQFLDWAFYWPGGAATFLTRPGVQSAVFDVSSKKLTLLFTDGVELAIPYDRLLGIDGATPADLAKVEVDETGTVLRWPELAVAISVPTLFAEIFASRRRLPSGHEHEWIRHVPPSAVTKLRKPKSKEKKRR